MKFTEIDEFKNYLKREVQDPSICPVRLVNVETMEAWVKVKAFLSGLSEHSLLLSSFCEDKDIAPNITRLKYAIRTSKKSSLVIPLSEYLRINNLVAEKTLVDILNANYENNLNGKLRIFIPVYRMKDILKEIDLDPRKTNCVLYLDSCPDSDYSLTIVQEDLEVSLQGNQTHGYQEYLMYWEQNPNKPVIFHTKNAIQYKDIVFADDVSVIVTTYELLRYHYQMPAEIKKDFGGENQWKELLTAYNQTKNFDNALSLLLSVFQYSESLFEKWPDYSPSRRWLLWLWTKFKKPGGYLGMIAAASSSVDEFVSLVHSEIINLLGSSKFTEMATQRHKLIRSMKLIPSQNFMASLSTLNLVDQILCLTDVSQQERRSILDAFANCEQSPLSKKALKDSFPDAYYYLDEIHLGNKRIDDYFSAYRELKLTNKVSNSFLEEVNDIAKNHSEPMWNLESRNALVNSLNLHNSVVLFIDALGVEYLSLLLRLFDKETYDVASYIGRCNLPSITEFNTDFLDGKDSIKFYELDNLKHKSINFPDNILAEFDLLKEIKLKVDQLLCEKSSVILTADHGTSRMAVLYRNNAPVYHPKENAELHKYGRYCIDTLNDYSNIEGCFPYNEYWIFSNYSRFSERGAPNCEIHGGASLEETIVPVLIIKKKSENIDRGYEEQIVVLTPTISVGTSKSASVKFKLLREYGSIVVVLGNKRIPCEYSNGVYIFNFEVGTSGTFIVKVISNGSILGEFSVKVIRGISKSEFDI